MSADKYNIKQLDDIVKKTIESLEEETQIYTIAEGARQEWHDLSQFAEIQK